MKSPTILIIMDGYGLADDGCGNAICLANTPHLDRLFTQNAYTTIAASGLDVGLPDGQMGNSEVGHTNIGAGRVVYQMLVKISQDIKTGKIKENTAINNAIANCKAKDSALHLMGLVSPGGVHSHMEHLVGLVAMAKEQGLSKVYVHAFMDGRDVPPASGADDIAWLDKTLSEMGCGSIATISGRYYAMDRDKAWDRVEKAYAALVYGEGETACCPNMAMKNSYAKEEYDEFVLPTVIDKNGTVKDGDSVIFFNFRPDRARQITRAFVDPAFDGFVRRGGKPDVHFVCMTQYDATMPNVTVAYPPTALTNTMGEVVAKAGKTQLRIAETQKYAHVTFFYNGGEECQFEGEDRILIQSPDVPTFDLKPEMSAYEVCDAVCEQIRAGKYDMIILNFANCDMVGHTGIIDAAIKAVEAVDECVGRVVDATLEMGGVALITADHGNADRLIDTDGSPFTAHTTNPVPLCVVGYPCELKDGGRLADLSPTMLQIMGLPQPEEMDGVSLIK